MGNRVHVVKKQIEYGKSGYFNLAVEEFKDLLSSLGCKCAQNEYSSDFEMPCDEYERAMTILTRIIEAKKKDKNMDLNGIDFSDLASPEDIPDWVKFDPDSYDFNDVIDIAKNLQDYSMEEILESMKIFWEERDKNSSWIQFCSF
jgi:hypothetical protein